MDQLLLGAFLPYFSSLPLIESLFVLGCTKTLLLARSSLVHRRRIITMMDWMEMYWLGGVFGRQRRCGQGKH